MQKNEIYETVITGMTAEGSGVCRVDGMAVFVPMTAVGDRLRVRIVKVLKSYAFGIIEDLHDPADGRQEPDCPVFRKCGGCVFRHVTYETELQYKAQLVEDAFRRIGGLDPAFQPILGAETRDGYRNKAQYPVTEQDGHLVCGFYARHSHRVVPFTKCALQPEQFTEVIEWLLPQLEAAGVTAYNEEAHTGELRHIYLRRGFHSGEMMLCLVTRVSVRKKIGKLLPEIQAQFPDLVSISESVNPERTNVIMGKQISVLAGAGCITDTMCGRKVEISPQSFYQVNTAQAERLYAVGKEFAKLTGTETLLDLYCGAGTIGLSMADRVKKLIGVEVVASAVDNARRNAAENHVDNAEFFCGDAGSIADRLRTEGTRPDVIVVDPPRKGCDALTVQSCAAMQPERIVMISCNPATAARDCKAFGELGYVTECVRAVDLFPGTAAVECVVLMTRMGK
ncbi:MAG: 23S rRNA (uracil(1939)-C(5))-methyltransferase RlmD [Oscillospiraceae bacterium]|nr:23S rRNA (uracil(1939)-C(5))-methyltransferase RlmD [Oscillospiraceae bacterium]